jgi:hypothetical protein
MKIYNISTVTRLKNGEFLQFMKNVIEVSDRSNADGLKLDKRLADLKSAILDLEEVFQTSTAHTLTPEIEAADEKRINAMRALKKVLDSNKLIGTDITRPVRILTENYESHARTLSRKSVAQKTATFDALYKDWNEIPGLTDAMNALELSKWLVLLQTANAEFNELYLTRAETTKQSGRINERRVTIKAIFDDLVRDLEAHIRLSDNSLPYQQLLSKINTLLRSYKSFNKNIKKESTGGDMPENLSES